LIITSQHQAANKKQGGIALLVLMIALALGFSVYYFSSISIVNIRVDNIETTRAVLKQAKQSLINYAITHANGNGNGKPGEYGYLPCPDSISNVIVEGEQDGTCGGQYKNHLGYLPWKALDIPALKDGSGNCLWYAISGNYKGENYSELINEDTNGLFQIVDIDGNIVEDRVAAVILAPGEALSGQVRNIDVATHCGEDYGNQASYLEGDGVVDNSNLPDIVDSVDQFIQATLTSDSAAIPYNDNLITITGDEIWQAIMKSTDINARLTEVTEALAICLSNFANDTGNSNKRLPWPATKDLDGIGDYRDMSYYSDELNAVTGYAGRFPFLVDDSNALLGIAATDMLINMGFCNSLIVTGGVNVDLESTNTEHHIILENWKDHFFYSVSKDYALPNNAWTGCSGNCVKVEDPVGTFTKYAAIIFFSGSPMTSIAQSRNDADKSELFNYLENGNDTKFPDALGNSVYATTNPDPLISNDIMFCITDDAVPAVIKC